MHPENVLAKYYSERRFTENNLILNAGSDDYAKKMELGRPHLTETD